MLLSICQDYRVLNVLYIIKIVIKIICVVAPVILILSVMITLLNYVFKGEDKSSSFNGVLKGMINKTMAAVIIFLVPTILNLVTGVIGFNDGFNCYQMATREGTDDAKNQYDMKREEEYKEAVRRAMEAHDNVQRPVGPAGSGGTTGVTGTGSQKMVQIAAAQLGNVGGEPYRTWYYGRNQSAAWCAIFVSWVANQAGYLNSTVPKFALCSAGADWFKQNNRWQTGSYVPNPGDIIFFDWKNSRDGVADHVGIVESVSGNNVTYISGNDGNTVKRNTYPVGYDSIYGYGVPSY